MPVLAPASGIIQRINPRLLLRYAQKEDLVIEYTYLLGDQAVMDTALAWVWTRDPDREQPDPTGDLRKRVIRSLQLGHERSVQADVAFGLTQLVDIALRAVSSAINDPTTARASIRSAEIVLVQLSKHRLGDRLIKDDDGIVRIAVPRRSFGDYLDMVVTPLRNTCPGDMAVMLRLCEMLEDVGRAAAHRAEQRERIAAQIELVKRAAIRAVEEQADLDKIFRAAHSVEVALAGKPPELS
ncbi:MAG TPA: hypothetical protein DDZ54_10355 [Erythrobacter sp.]|nr:hypothetical protein [Erythrobacter sp.]